MSSILLLYVKYFQNFWPPSWNYIDDSLSTPLQQVLLL